MAQRVVNPATSLPYTYIVATQAEADVLMIAKADDQDLRIVVANSPEARFAVEAAAQYPSDRVIDLRR